MALLQYHTKTEAEAAFKSGTAKDRANVVDIAKRWTDRTIKDGLWELDERFGRYVLCRVTGGALSVSWGMVPWTPGLTLTELRALCGLPLPSPKKDTTPKGPTWTVERFNAGKVSEVQPTPPKPIRTKGVNTPPRKAPPKPIRKNPGKS